MKENKKQDQDDEDIETQGMPNQIFIAAQKNISCVYTVFFDEVITKPSYYRKLLVMLNMADETDTFVFRISTPGGNADSVLSICNAIQATDATTVAVIEAEASSAGSFIPMVCDTVIALPHSYMMCHPAFYGNAGDMKTMKRYTEFYNNRLHAMLSDIYEGFLTPEEINDMVDNSQDLLFTADEIISRLEKREKHRAILLDNERDLDQTLAEETSDTKCKKRTKKEKEE